MRLAIAATAIAGALALVPATGRGASQGPLRPPPGRQDLPHVKVLGAALSVFDDRIAHVVAAYYYAQRYHDGPWILVEFGMRARRAMRLERDRIEIETPDGEVIPLSGQRRWGADGRRAQQLLQQIVPSRHQVRPYFGSSNQITRLRFFSRPEDGYTVVNGEDVVWEPILIGDLLFESPTGAWAPGRYVLAVGHQFGIARLPLDLK